VGILQAAVRTRRRCMGLGGGAWGSKGTTLCGGGLPHPRRKSWIVLTPYPSARSPHTIAETDILLRALRVPLRQASKSRHEAPQPVQAARRARAGCTSVREHGRQSPRHGLPSALLGASGLIADGLLSPPARHEREPSRSTPGTNDDLRCGSSAAVPAARPRRGCGRSSHRVPVVDQVQDDEPDEGADVDEHGPTGKQRLGHGRRGEKSTACHGSPHAIGRTARTSTTRRNVEPGASWMPRPLPSGPAMLRRTRATRAGPRRAHAGEPPPGSP